MIILGINDGHDASACIMVDGRVISAVAEERLVRRKHMLGFPAKSIDQVLSSAGVTPAEIDKIAVSSVHLPPKYQYVRRDVTFTVKDYLREQTDYWYPIFYEGKSPNYNDIFQDKLEIGDQAFDQTLISDEDDAIGFNKAREKLICDRLGKNRDKVKFYDHHGCHAYYAFGAMPWREQRTLIYTADGAGDNANGTVWLSEPGKQLKSLARTELCNIGRIYRYITLLLGMKPNEHEYKVMGLAPYAREQHGESAYNVFKETLRVKGLEFDYDVKPRDHFFHFKERLDGERFDNIAYGLQRFTEELLVEWVENGIAETGVNHVAISGGVAQNVKANKRIIEQESVAGFFVPPGPGDESLCMGAAYWEYVNFCKRNSIAIEEIMPLENPYLGRKFSNKEVKDAISCAGISNIGTIEPLQEEKVAKLIENGDIVARCAGRMEFGPRALGNRSIIADPRRIEVIAKINNTVKQRDFWMPFAASILSERADDYFTNPKNAETRYMTTSFDTTAEGRRCLAAGTHQSDHSTRPQVVYKNLNAPYHALISAFERRTGVGAVLNTSFNLHGEPIVESPADAISTFMRSDLQHLILEDLLISKVN